MQIYIYRNNQQIGPFTETEVKAQLAAGTISLEDNVWWEGQAGWVPLSQSSLATQTAAIGSAPLPPPPTPFQSAPIPPAPAASTGKTSGLAIASLICSIVGLFCGLLSIAGIVCGHLSRAQIKKNPSLQGSGIALAGLIIGYVWLPIYTAIFTISFLIALGNQVKPAFSTVPSLSTPGITTNSADPTTSASDQSANNASPSTSNSDQPTSSTEQTTNAPDQSTNAPDQSTNSPDQSIPSTNSPDASTNAAPAPMNSN